MLIKLLRHGESKANTGELNPLEVGDHRIPLTQRGVSQAEAAGRILGGDFLRKSLVYTSPYLRARQTLNAAFQGAGMNDPGERPRIYEDPRLREVEHGYSDPKWQNDLRKIHGWFYYRFTGGESPADCYDRTSGFLDSLMQQTRKKKTEHVLIVTHGLTLRCFLMRFLFLSVEQFEGLQNPENCDIITVGLNELVPDPQWSKGKWAVSGLRFHDRAAWPGLIPIRSEK